MSEMISGRCKPCGIVYQWPSGQKRRLKHAWCPECFRRLLRVTAVSLIVAPTISKQLPLFGSYEPRRTP